MDRYAIKTVSLPKPIGDILEAIIKGEYLIVEYNSIADVSLLPLRLTLLDNTILIVLGDKIHTKLYALMEALKEIDPNLLDKLVKTPIISISNVTLKFPNLNIINIPLSELTGVISKLYTFIKDGYEDWLIVSEGLEQLTLYFDTKSALKELASLKTALPNTTLIGFLNYDAVDKKTLALFESCATSVVRIEGWIDLELNRIKKRIYVIKSIGKVKKGVAEIDYEF